MGSRSSRWGSTTATFASGAWRARSCGCRPRTIAARPRGSKHVIVATRGTRAEHSKADIFTDLRGSLTSFGGFGQVHHGFKNTFDSVKAGLVRDDRRIMDADVVHCVGHSLGGAVATLVA